MGLVRSTHAPLTRATVAIVGTLIAATLAVGALAISHSASDDLAGRKIGVPYRLAKGETVPADINGGGKPVR
jgi:hypothetical protein